MVVLGFVLAFVGLALTFLPVTSPRLRVIGAAACWIAAGELLLTYFLHGTAELVACIGWGLIVLIFAVWWTPGGDPSADGGDSDAAAFETSDGGHTIVEGGSIRGYRRVSRVASGVAHFVRVKIRR